MELWTIDSDLVPWNLVGYYGVYDVPSEAFERAYTATSEETVNA